MVPGLESLYLLSSPQSLKRTLSRPKLVFWKFQAITYIIAQFLIIIILDSTKVICLFVKTIPLLVVFFLILTLILAYWLGYVDIDGQNRTFLLPLLLTLLAMDFFVLAKSLRKI